MTERHESDDITESLGEMPEMGVSIVLLGRAKDGDSQALGALLQRYEKRVRRIVAVRTGVRLQRLVQIDDLVQEVFVRATRGLEGFQPQDGASIIKWLAAMAENAIRDEVRYWEAAKRDASREVALDDADLAVRADSSERTPSSAARQAEFGEVLDELLRELPDGYREAILLRDYHGGPWEFVRQELGKGTVKAAQEVHRRATRKLAELVQRRFGA